MKGVTLELRIGAHWVFFLIARTIKLKYALLSTNRSLNEKILKWKKCMNSGFEILIAITKISLNLFVNNS